MRADGMVFSVCNICLFYIMEHILIHKCQISTSYEEKYKILFFGKQKSAYAFCIIHSLSDEFFRNSWVPHDVFDIVG